MPISITSGVYKDRYTVEQLPAAFPIDPTTVAGVQPVGQSGYNLTFSDEFNGSSLDLTKWDWAYPDWPRFNAQDPGGRYTNSNNANCYAQDYVSVSGGSCILRADNTSTIAGLPYTAGMISSLPSYNALYGYMECRARLPVFPGYLWPAIWMSSSDYDTWPPEIDVMEAGLVGGYNIYQIATYLPGDSFSAQPNTGIDITKWSVYGCSWTPTAVTFYYNGTQVGSTTKTPTSNQYLLVDMAAVWGATFTSATMEIDYVRYWQ